MAQNVKDKSSLGSSSSSLIKCIFDYYRAQSAAQFIDDCQFLASCILYIALVSMIVW